MVKSETHTVLKKKTCLKIPDQASLTNDFRKASPRLALDRALHYVKFHTQDVMIKYS